MACCSIARLFNSAKSWARCIEARGPRSSVISSSESGTTVGADATPRRPFDLKFSVSISGFVNWNGRRPRTTEEVGGLGKGSGEENCCIGSEGSAPDALFVTRVNKKLLPGIMELTARAAWKTWNLKSARW